MNRAQIKAAIAAALNSEINVTLPATATHGALTIGNGQILLESFMSENGARNVITVGIDDLINTLGLEDILAAKSQIRFTDLIGADAENIKGYHKYLNRWKDAGKIS